MSARPPNRIPPTCIFNLCVLPGTCSSTLVFSIFSSNVFTDALRRIINLERKISSLYVILHPSSIRVCSIFFTFIRPKILRLSATQYWTCHFFPQNFAFDFLAWLFQNSVQFHLYFVNWFYANIKVELSDNAMRLFFEFWKILETQPFTLEPCWRLILLEQFCLKGFADFSLLLQLMICGRVM